MSCSTGMILLRGSITSHSQRTCLRRRRRVRRRVQVEMREGEVLQGAVMQARALLPSACQPGGDRFRVRPTHASSRCHIQAFAQRSEHFPDTGGGSFEAIERGIATGAESRAAGLTVQGLNAVACAM